MSEQHINLNAVYEYLQNLQNRIVEAVELIDGKNFLHDSWQRPGRWWWNLLHA
jgi:coproporphyrinogen III oxidase